MRARADLSYETQSDPRRTDFLTPRPQPFDRLLNEIDLVNRIDIDRVNAGAYRVVEFVITLARPIEDDLVGPKTDSQCLEQLATAVDFDINSRFQHDFENRHVRVCL